MHVAKDRQSKCFKCQKWWRTEGEKRSRHYQNRLYFFMNRLKSWGGYRRTSLSPIHHRVQLTCGPTPVAWREKFGYVRYTFGRSLHLRCRTRLGEQALAALVQGRARGLLATSSDLELGLLQSCFQLDDYEHLVKVRQTNIAKEMSHTRIWSDAYVVMRTKWRACRPSCKPYFTVEVSSGRLSLKTMISGHLSIKRMISDALLNHQNIL